MKKLLIALCFTCALALAVQAEEGKKYHNKLTVELKSVMNDLVTKYDTNKDGKLDKEERAKISAEDKEKMQKAGLGRKGKKKDK